MEQKYEFDAPLYVDFEAIRDGRENGDDVDHWFSNHLEDDKRPPCLSALTSKQGTFSNDFSSEPSVKEEPPTSDCDETTETSPAGSEDVKPLAVPVKEERERGENSSKTQPLAKIGQKRSFAIASLQTPTVVKHQRVQRASSKKAATTITNILRHTQSHSVSAKTPEHMRRYLAKKQGEVKKTREQLDAEEMEEMQEESKRKLREYRKSFARLADSTKKPKKMKYSKPTTESVVFKFRTDRRCLRRRVAGGAAARPPPHSSETHPNNFPMTLRSASKTVIQPEVSHKKCTEAKPFNFRLESRLTTREITKRRDEEEEEKKGYVSTAEYIFKFHSEDPERFRSLPRKSTHSVSTTVNDATQSGKSATAACGGITLPYTPKLQTKNRARPTLVKSSAELEEEELARIRGNPIKPLLLNPKVITEQGLMGVPMRTHRHVTQPRTPTLATKERGEARGHGSGESEDENHTSFKAQPLPKGLFDKVLGLPKKETLPMTCPESPAFALKRRNLHRNTNEDEEEKCQIVIARPVPDFSRKFEPQLSHKKTEPEPFAFEERYKDKPTRETLVQQILQKEKREPFKANPVPNFDGPILPPARTQPMTEPKTPLLHTKARGREYESKWKQTLGELTRKAKENAEFRAKDAKFLYKPPFVAAKVDRPMTEVSNILLCTAVRSEQRAKFDMEREQNEQLMEQENRERQALAAAEEAKKVAQLRRSLIHKALPIRHYTPTVVLPSSKPLTAPHSPHFHLRLRGMH